MLHKFDIFCYYKLLCKIEICSNTIFLQCTLILYFCILFSGETATPRAILTGHDTEVKCAAVCTELGLVVSGSVGKYTILCSVPNWRSLSHNIFLAAPFRLRSKFEYHYGVHAWKKCGIWESYSREMLLLEGNLCNFEGKFIILMDISVFFLQKILKICKKITFFTQFVTIFQGNFAFFPALMGYIKIEVGQNGFITKTNE